MIKKRVTLKDLAQKTGLSISAVSQVLNNNPNSFTSEKTRKRVLDLANEMGYTSNYAYKMLRGKSMNTASVMLSLQNNDDHIRDLLIMLLQRFDDMGIVASTNVFSADAEKNIRKVHELISRGMERFVFLGSPFGNQEIESLLRKNGLPYISTSPFFSRFVRWSVESNMKELYHFLHGEIGDNFRLAVWRNEVKVTNYRVEALAELYPQLSRKSLLEEKVLFFDDFATPLKSRDHHALMKAGSQLTGRALSQFPEIKGLCFSNDYYALGALEAAAKKKLTVGKDLLLTGFGNTLAVQCHPSPVSSVALDVRAIADAIFEGLDEKDEQHAKYINVKTVTRK